MTKAFSCDAVLNSKASKLFGIIKMSDIGIVYFMGGLVLLLFSFYGMTEVQKTLDMTSFLSVCSFPYIIFSLSYQRLKVKKWCPLCLGVLTVLLLENILGWTAALLEHSDFQAHPLALSPVCSFYSWRKLRTC